MSEPVELGDRLMEAGQLLLQSPFHLALPLNPLVVEDPVNDFTPSSSSITFFRSLFQSSPSLLLQRPLHLPPSLLLPNLLVLLQFGRRSCHRRRWKHIQYVWVATTPMDASVVDGRLINRVPIKVVAAPALPTTLSVDRVSQQRPNSQLN